MHKILMRNGFSVHWENRLSETQATILTHPPDIFIADIKNALKNEITYLASICLNLQGAFLIILGGPMDIGAFEKQVSELVLENNLFLTDPLSPDLIVSKVKELFALRKNIPQTRIDGLENDLKQFLKL